MLSINILIIIFSVTKLIDLNFLGIFGLVINTFFYLFSPGYLLNPFKRNEIGNVRSWAIYLSISLTFYMLIGLTLNFFPAQFSFKPLTRENINLIFNSIILSLGIIRTIIFLFTEKFNFNFKKLYLPLPNVYLLIFCTVLLLLPFQAIIGANMLNGGGSNFISIANYVEIAFLIVLISLFKGRNQKVLFPLSIFCISLALLYSFTFRSNFLVGWDIQQEALVQNLTQVKAHWSYENIRDPYNACLSITLLPTILVYLLNTTPIMVFKMIFPIVMSMVVVLSYKIFHSFTSNFNAFLGSLIILSQPQFITESTMLTRQIVALLFYVQIIYLLFVNRGQRKRSSFLLYLFTISLVISHYSTTYITFLELFFVCIIAFFYEWFYKLAKLIVKRIKPNQRVLLPDTMTRKISLIYIIYFVVVMFLWYSQITTAGSGALNFVKNTYKTLSSSVDKDLKSESAKAAIWNSSESISQEDLNYYADSTAEKLKGKVEYSLYEKSLTDKFPLTLAFPKSVPSKYKINIKNSLLFFQLIALSLKLFLVIGFVVYIIQNFFVKDKANSIVFLNSLLFGGIFLFLVVPYLSVAYNIERLTLQALFSLGFFIPLGAFFFINLIKKKTGISLTPLFISLIILYFSSSSGLIWQIIGGPASIPFNNYGELYNRFYVDKQDIASVNWLNTNRNYTRFVYTDRYGRLSFTGKPNLGYNIVENVVPQAIDKYSYVYGTTANFSNGIASIKYSQKEINYSFPNKFLMQNKNLIYSNNQSVVYQ